MKYICFIALLSIIFILELIKRKKSDLISITKDSILYAEKYMKSVDGKIKFKYVCSAIRTKLPKIISPFIKEEHITTFIQQIFDSIYDYLDHRDE
ncbi:MAG TPA: hypothetical protein GX747_00330 [Tenericutes bacterium]|nr:hypothetical protein [Mycoplasmatota bacterium]